MDDYYTVLGLSHRRHDHTLNAADIRKAYRQTLLKHHPDKLESDNIKNASADLSRDGKDTYTVDQITAASTTLSDPATRAEYDRSLRQQNGNDGDAARFFSGLDIVDLDDLDYDESHGIWQRGCRCGHQRGFVVTEDDLEAAITHGELITGCRGCSLWLKVLFQAAPEDDTEGDVNDRVE